MNIANKINAALDALEQERKIKVLYACESGSRAWGFASQNSDYDIRFIYIHHPDWYLTIHNNRDVIEQTLENDLDIAGWDIRKALMLFRKSNPPLLEWLQSPIVYKQDEVFLESLRQLVAQYYSPRSCMYHYFHMAEGHFREYLRGDIVWLKKHFYVLRPLLACKWIETKEGPPPIEFNNLVSSVVTSELLRQDIAKLQQQKQQGQELDKGLRVPSISLFIQEELEKLMASDLKTGEDLSYEPLNELFRDTLRRIWI